MTPKRRSILLRRRLAALTASACIACGEAPERQPAPGGAAAIDSGAAAAAPAPPSAAAPVLDTVATGLSTPWAVAFAPDGRIFFTERPGRIRVIRDGALQAEPWATVDVASTGEAGLMGLALSPRFDNDGYVFVAGTVGGPGGTLVNRVLRYTDEGGRGTSPAVIVPAIPAARFHAGCAVAFGPDRKLYVATGDARAPDAAHDPRSLAGKILRLEPDGTIPADNPIAGSPVYALGVRNPQGLAWHPESGDLFATDHGPSGFPDEGFRRNADELNVILAGEDYGWPEVAGRGEGEGFVDPIVEWTPALAPSGLALYDGPRGDWRGSAFVGALRGRHLRRVRLERAAGSRTGWRAAGEQELFGFLGRIRAVAMAPDGALYFTTSNRDGRGDPSAADDMILRVR